MTPSAMADIIGKTYYYPNLVEAIIKEIGQCPPCMTQKANRQKHQKFGKKTYLLQAEKAGTSTSSQASKLSTDISTYSYSYVPFPAS